MTSAEIQEDEIDTEALQAQIDLSMSFAQSLVSSWVQPHKFPSSSRGKNIEQELTELMKRPPRLGVGATIPEGVQSMTRETARLKGKLAGSKRPIEEGPLSKSSSDDEGESRAVAIKKKAKPDPFDIVHGKKRKKNKGKEPGSSAQSAAPSLLIKEIKMDSSDEIEGLLRAPDDQDDRDSPVKVKKDPMVEKPLMERTNSSVSQLKAISPSPSDEDDDHHAPSQSPVQSPNPINAGGSSIKAPKSNRNLSSDLFKVPLLNLNGPPTEQDSEDETTTPSATAKKKRKRKKKKKNHGVFQSTDIQSSLPQTT